MMQSLRQLPIFKLDYSQETFLSLLAVFSQSFIPHIQALIKVGNEDIISSASLTVLCKPSDVVEVVFSVSHFYALPTTLSAVLLGLLLRNCEFISLSEIFFLVMYFYLNENSLGTRFRKLFLSSLIKG